MPNELKQSNHPNDSEKTKLIKVLESEHFWQLCMNGENHNGENAIRAWETTEQGTTRGIYAAYKRVLSQTEEVDFSPALFNQLNELCLLGCRIAQSQKNIEDLPGIFRTRPAAFGITFGKTLTELGLNWLFDENYTIATAPQIGTEITEAQKEGEPLYVIAHVKDFEAEINSIINTYKADCSKTNDIDEKIKIIAIAIKKLELMHPWTDANLRVLGIVVLNAMLVKEGISATVLRYPNVIDGFSIEEIVTAIKEGQSRFNQLYTKITMEEDISPELKKQCDYEFKHIQDNQRNLLHDACSIGNLRLVEVIINYARSQGCLEKILNMQDSNHLKPLDIAKINQHEAIENYLLSMNSQ